ncbi:putative conserved membrane protein [Synechococcus sp. BIOS-E4-1]|uniref:hypothetical protein n=1 Tax=Synechococcus sp. BIOS-E4-1 TaxID=1400864 RepID=UPI0016458142|nr:hypothetical protein [Synechococcus sp. BIOS-E4-1]QNI54690.1 putative conserved membrane protein [Synechococcus sp. BIOS-E4-1]
MTPLQRLLLIPSLLPLLLTLLVGGLNLGKTGSLRILTWELPRLPLGVWMAVAATSGAVLGSGAVLAAGSSTQQTLQREVRRPYSWQEESPELDSERAGAAAATMPWPERDLREPAPTVSVPFRVIRTGRTTKDSVAQSDLKERAVSDPAQTSTTVADDWDQPLPADW